MKSFSFNLTRHCLVPGIVLLVLGIIGTYIYPLFAGETQTLIESSSFMNLLIDEFIECGVNIFYPCEPAADMDIVKLREKYGHAIAFRGGIDKHIIRRTKEEIKAEIDYKMQDKMLEGGVVFGLDHRIPNGTPFENYVYYVNYAREKLGLPPFEQDEPGWGRMAF